MLTILFFIQYWDVHLNYVYTCMHISCEFSFVNVTHKEQVARMVQSITFLLLSQEEKIYAN